MLTQQLTIFQQDVQVIKESGITMYRCSKDAARWLTPDSPCPMCFPSQQRATCDHCGSEFTDDRYMLEHMRIGGDVLCEQCLPRITVDDCRDPDRLHREAEDRRLTAQSERERAKTLTFQPTTDN